MAYDLHRLEAIFNEVLATATPAERAEILARECGADAELRAHVERLVSAHEAAPESFLPLPERNAATGAEYSHPEGPGTVIGPYRLLQMIGEGGFGTVFMAEQEWPVRRRVALKIIKLGMDTKQVIARFEAERQALALMDHPNVAKVFDAGAAPSGRPFFVMELVRGLPITEYCDQHHLSVPKRVALFVQICQAVQHAHQKGLIHRDIKPSNVLVATQDDRPTARVIDFGIAKATEARLTEKTLFTQFGQWIGTPEYMSPEQAEGSLDIDTRSDLYSLGVLLYELLAGTPPLAPADLRGKAFGEIQRIIREVDPPKPSTRLSGSAEIAILAAHRGGIAPKKLPTQVRGELDWIVMCCLEKDRARRYQSASALASDLLHYLADEPVQACPPSTGYRLRKFTRRHKGAVISAGIVLIVLVAGITGTTLGLMGQKRQRERADLQRDRAEHQAAITEAVSKFQSDMLSSADPQRLLGDQVTVLQAMMAALKELDAGKLAHEPLVEASVRETIGRTLHALGRDDEAERVFRKALELRHRHEGERHLDTAATLLDLSTALEGQGRFNEAEQSARESIDIRRNAEPGGHSSLRHSLYALGVILCDQARYEEAEGVCREGLALCRKYLPADHQDIADYTSKLALLLHMQGHFEEAEKLHRKAMAIWRRALPPNHPSLTDPIGALAGTLCAVGNYTESEQLFREAVAISKKAFPAGHRTIGSSLCNLALPLERQGKYAEAEESVREALDIFERVLPPGHAELGATLNNLAYLVQEQDRNAEAETLYRKALEIDRQTLGKGHPAIAMDLANLAQLLSAQGKLAEAETRCREALEIMRGAHPPGHPEIATCLERLGGVLHDEGKLVEAEEALRESLEIRRKPGSREDGAVAASLNALGGVLRDRDKISEAEAAYREALELRRKFPEGHPFIVQSMQGLAWCVLDQNRYNEAAQIFRQSMDQLAKGGASSDDWRMGIACTGLGKALTGLGQFSEAETALIHAERSLVSPNRRPGHHESSLEALVALYQNWHQTEPAKGYDAKAKKWRERLSTLTPSSQPTTQTAPA